MKKLIITLALTFGIFTAGNLGPSTANALSDMPDLPTQHSVKPVITLSDMPDLPTQHSVKPVITLSDMPDLPTQHSVIALSDMPDLPTQH
nr:hypothetical protein [Paenibacillus bovis]